MNRWLQKEPLDRLSLSAIAILTVVIAGLMLTGQVCGSSCPFLRVAPRVTSFTWDQQIIGAQDTAFILTFDRAMERQSVEDNLVIEPPLPGKLSWSGRRLAYTLLGVAPYGQSYELSLSNAQSAYSDYTLKNFTSQFRTRDRAFAYIGSQGDEEGRLMLWNFTQQSNKEGFTPLILTPPNLNVVDFEFYPDGNKILFSAAPRGSDNSFQDLKIFSVNIPTTGERTPKIEVILDNRAYQNYNFGLSPDGKSLVVQRVSRENPAEFGLWIVRDAQPPQPLNISGGEFAIAPDGSTLAVAQGEGIALLPLEPDAEPLDFLPKFGRLLNFSADGSAAALIDFHAEDPERRFTRSVVYANNQGITQELLSTDGSIKDCQFSPRGTRLYCLITELIEGEDVYQEQPFFTAIDLETGTVTPLLALPFHQDIQISLAPDGLGILFDQITTGLVSTNENDAVTESGELVTESSLWLLILPTADEPDAQLEQIPLAGFHPEWLP
ncbi:MAG: hypothetical protein AAGG02_04240 [Cyanobacteria bacterium P01_H01_bin.15]